MKKVLIVDDDSVMLKLADRVLSRQYETVCATSGEEAIELFVKEKPAMVLSDLRMPKMDGYELQKRIQEQSEDRIPFIFMTADESDESESRGFEEGAEDYIRKPFKADLLLKRMERISDNLDESDRLKKAASTDAMTGLLNKTATANEMSALCAEKPGMILMIDLDSFKLVNDIYGHDMGDRVLIRFSYLLRSQLREEDVAGRVGGDEFMAYLSNNHEEAAVQRITEFLNSELLKSAREYMGVDMEIDLGVSVGAIDVHSHNGLSFEELSSRADDALYQVKQEGKHGYRIYQKGDENVPLQDTESNLRNIRMIFGERNIHKGANVVERD